MRLIRNWPTAVLAAGLAACAPEAPTDATPAAGAPVLARSGDPTAWAPAVSIEQASAALGLPGADASFNGAVLDGCPVSSRDGKTFYIASTRDGGPAGRDIYVSTRASVDDPWGPPVNVGAPVNSPYNDYCPMPDRDGHGFFFVSNRPGPGTCGGADIYHTRQRGDGSWDEPEHLGCQVNSAADEEGPVPVNEPGRGPVLYFSSARPGGPLAEPQGATSGDFDLYASEWRGGSYAAPALVPGVNSAAADGQPYIQQDALELYFYSNRAGSLGGSNDIWVASRERAQDPWTAPVHLGPNVNTIYPETRPSLSWDGSTLYFGSTRPTGEGSSDVYVTTRRAPRGGR